MPYKYLSKLQKIDLNCFWRRFGVKFFDMWLAKSRTSRFFHRFAVALCILACFKTGGQALAASIELYSERPEVSRLTPKKHSELGASWKKIRRGLLEMTAMLLEIYPDHEIYFLARDGESQYDLARLLDPKNPKLHLVNISSLIMNSELLEEYLAQIGVVEAIKNGKKILFVDTGFEGRIAKKVQTFFPDKLKSRIQSQLISSYDWRFPSSRVFLSYVGPYYAAGVPSHQFKPALLSYEHMAHYTFRSSGFRKINGLLVPIGSDDRDGKVSRARALAYMEDLAQYSTEPQTIALIQHRRAIWRSLYQAAKAGDLQLEKVIKDMLAGGSDPAENYFRKAYVKDFLEAWNKNLNPKQPFDPERVGLAPFDLIRTNEVLVRSLYPEYSKLLDDPEKGIERLIQIKDWKTLELMTDSLRDREGAFTQALAKSLPAAGSEGRDFARRLIFRGDSYWLRPLALFTFSDRRTVEWTYELRELIERSFAIDDDARTSMAQSLFRYQHVDKWLDILSRFIEISTEQREQGTLGWLADSLIMTQKSGPEWDEIYRQILESTARLKSKRIMNHFTLFAERVNPDPKLKKIATLLEKAIRAKDRDKIQRLLDQLIRLKGHFSNVEDQTNANSPKKRGSSFCEDVFL